MPSDTTMRERLDRVDPDRLWPAFRTVLARLQRRQTLDACPSFDKATLLSIDGTPYDSSHTVHGDPFCRKDRRNGTVTTDHPRLGAARVHPDLPVVGALAPEIIRNPDGTTPTDGARRLRSPPHRPVVNPRTDWHQRDPDQDPPGP